VHPRGYAAAERCGRRDRVDTAARGLCDAAEDIDVARDDDWRELPSLVEHGSDVEQDALAENEAPLLSPQGMASVSAQGFVERAGACGQRQKVGLLYVCASIRVAASSTTSRAAMSLTGSQPAALALGLDPNAGVGVGPWSHGRLLRRSAWP
jgi:hypothetical protein